MAGPARIVMGGGGGIIEAWWAPARVMRAKLADRASEGRLLAILLAACGLMAISQTPWLLRLSLLDPAQPFERALAYTVFAWLMLWPLAFYAAAALARLCAAIFGGGGTWWKSRLALFWALLAASPGALVYGLVRGFAGDGLASRLAGAVWLVAFLAFWVANTRVAEHRDA